MRTMKMRWIAGAAAVLAAAACASAAPKVPVSAGPGGADALVGLWEGSYESAATGRGGSVVFHLDAGRDTAQGDVVMIPRGSSVPFRRFSGDTPGGGVAPPTGEPLTIRFVRVEGDRVRGELVPYLDPDCNCAANTSFEGTIRGDRIRGTFITQGSLGSTSGTWSVARRLH